MGHYGATRFIIAVALFLPVFGLLVDLVCGLPVLRSSRSWTAAALGTVALGVLGGVGEVVGGWISGKVSDPLWKRVWHLALLLTFALVLAAAFAAVARMVQ